jgi:hypothetical protein
VTVRRVLVGGSRRGLLDRLAAVVAVLALALTYAVWPRPSELSRAAALLPASAQRVLWTDWKAIRADRACRTWSACEKAMDDADLSAATVLAGSADALTSQLAWGPETVDWELLGQAKGGEVLIVHLPDVEKVMRAYERAGFTPPAKHRSDGGVWEGGGDVLSDLGIEEPLFDNVAFLAGDGLLLSSDSASWLAHAVTAATGGRHLDFGLTGELEEPLAAVGLVGDRACSELSFATADTGAQAEATQLVDAAGGVNPLDGYLVGLGHDHAWAAALAFESDDQARHDLLPRQRLAAGQDPGQMLSYRDLFRLDAAERHGRDIVLRGHARPSAYALTQVSQGPVLLASC